MIYIFCKIKHWQILSLVILPFILLNYVHYLNNYNLELVTTLLLFFLTMFIGLIWFVSVGNFLGKTLKEKEKTLYFNINILLTIGYLVFIYTYAFLQSGDTFSTNITVISTDSSANPLFTGSIVPIIFLINLYIVLAFFYNVYFVANCISKLNSKKDSIKNLFLIWFFPIGIWFIQPKINKIYYNATIKP